MGLFLIFLDWLQAFKEAIGELDKLAQEPYTHARLQLQSLRDNLTLWNYDNQVHDI